jgi:hypothetical protein
MIQIKDIQKKKKKCKKNVQTTVLSIKLEHIIYTN